MTQVSPAQLELARKLLAGEMKALSDPAEAAARCYEKIHFQLSPVIGTAGVRAVFARSVHLTQSKYLCLKGYTDSDWEIQNAEDPARGLRAWFQRNQSVDAAELAEVLFGNFFTLLVTFIGERLTAQVLKGAWPEAFPPGPIERKT